MSLVTLNLPGGVGIAMLGPFAGSDFTPSTGRLEEATSTRFVVADLFGKQTYTGVNFTYGAVTVTGLSATTQLTVMGGTIQGATYQGSSGVSSTITGLNVNAATLGPELVAGAFAGTREKVSSILLGNADTINGTSGNDFIRGYAGNDVINGGAGDDSLIADAGDDELNGGSGNDTLEAFSLWNTGNAGNTEFGSNILRGGPGDDLYRINSTSDVVIESFGEGTDTVSVLQSSYTLPANVENLTLAGNGQFTGTGNALNNILRSAFEQSWVCTLAGGQGDDTYILDSTDLVVEAADAGTDTVKVSFSYTLPSNVENLTLFDVTLTGASAINGTGNALDNVLTGNSGANTLTGGLGDDTYGVDNAGDVVVESALEGTDTIQSSISFNLTSVANVENLTLVGSAALTGTGNLVNNVIRGNAGGNVLTGGGGNDTLVGGGGEDTVMLSQAKAAYALQYAGGKISLTSATDTTSVGTMETLHFGDGQEQSVASFFLESANDATGDGRADIYWRNVDGSVALWEMNGLSLTQGASVGSAPTSWSISAKGDLNGDGNADLVWRNSDGQVAGWLMDGANVLAGGALCSGAIPTDYKIVDTADFDGDGKSDLLWRNDSGVVAVWLMDGLTLRSGLGLGEVPTNWKISGTGDFNGDGNGDILWRNTDGEVAMWLMNGGSVLQGASAGSAPTDWKIAGTGDFNADGKSDILWRHDQGLTAIWEMDGFTPIAADGVAFAPTDWKIAGTGDYNGDLRTDILWRHDGGQVAEWHMNGFAVQNADGVGGPVPNDWMIV